MCALGGPGVCQRGHQGTLGPGEVEPGGNARVQWHAERESLGHVTGWHHGSQAEWLDPVSTGEPGWPSRRGAAGLEAAKLWTQGDILAPGFPLPSATHPKPRYPPSYFQSCKVSEYGFVLLLLLLFAKHLSKGEPFRQGSRFSLRFVDRAACDLGRAAVSVC